MAERWKYIHAGQSHGPFSAEEIADLYQKGQIQPQDPVYSPEMSNWKPAKEVLHLFHPSAPPSPTPEQEEIPLAPVLENPYYQTSRPDQDNLAPEDSGSGSIQRAPGRRSQALYLVGILFLLICTGIMVALVYLVQPGSPPSTPPRPVAKKTSPPTPPLVTLPRKLKPTPIGAQPRAVPSAVTERDEEDEGPGEYSRVLGRTNARRILYLVDASASMRPSFDFVRAEITRSIRCLKPSQAFHILLFGGGKIIENPPRRFILAQEPVKQQAEDFLQDLAPHGETDPRLALERAFQVQDDGGQSADLIYLLTDGELPEDTLALVATLNRSKKTQINTIALVSEAGRKLLETLAKQNQGKFKFVSQYELVH